MTLLNSDMRLRPTIAEDLPYLFQIQQDEKAGWMAAFTPGDRFHQKDWLARHSAYLADPDINNQTILVDGSIAGSIAKFIMEGQAEITYWLDRSYWGKGIGSRTLKSFLEGETTRPLHGRVAFDNLASRKILEAAGFHKIGSDSGFANARGAIIEEYIYVLD